MSEGYGATHGALAMSTPGDTSMVRVEEVEVAKQR
jgi:2-dehydro-3-deoxygluconokinase